MSQTRQHGFSAIEVVIAVVVVAAIGATGYLAFSRMRDAGKSPSAADQVEQASAPTAPATISSTGDLDKSAKALDNTNLDASANDTADLDSELNSF